MAAWKGSNNYGLCNWRGLRYQWYQNRIIPGGRHCHGKCHCGISHVSAEKRLCRTRSGRLEKCHDPDHSGSSRKERCCERGNQRHRHLRTDARSGHAGQGQSGAAELHHLVRPADSCGSGRDEPHGRSGEAHGNHRKSGTDRMDSCKDSVGPEQRAGGLREVPSHSAAEGLSALDSHRRVCHRGF